MCVVFVLLALHPPIFSLADSMKYRLTDSSHKPHLHLTQSPYNWESPRCMTSLRAWFRPPRHLLAMFLAITLAPSALLIGFGWRWLDQDRALELRHIGERREQTVDLAVASLQQSLAAVERQLRADPFGLPQSEDSVAVVLRPGAVQGKLLYYPVAATSNEAPPGVFAVAEHAEFLAHDPARAGALLRDLTRSSDKAVRAGALIRLARVLRNSGQPAAALAAYADAARLNGPLVSGVPVSLFALWATCDLLDALNRREDLRREAAGLYRQLLDGHWQLDRGAWQLNVEDARRWMGDGARPEPSRRLIGPGRRSGMVVEQVAEHAPSNCRCCRGVNWSVSRAAQSRCCG